MKGFLGLPIRLATIAFGAVVGAFAWQRPPDLAPGFLVAMSGFAFLWSISRAFFRLRTRVARDDENSIWGGSLWTSPLPRSREGNFFVLALLFLCAGAASIGYALARGNDPRFGGPLLAVGLGQCVGIFLFRRFNKARTT